MWSICFSLRLSACSVISSARDKQEQYPFQVSESISNHLEEIFVIGHYLVESSVAACCLQCGTFFCTFCNFFVFWIIVSSLRTFSVRSGSLLYFLRSSFYPHVSFMKSCAYHLRSCSPNPLLRKIDTLRFGPSVIDHMFREILDVFQWDRECFIIWVVKLQTRFFMMSIEKFSILGPQIFCFASLFCRRLRIQHHLLAQGFPPLSMIVLDD